MQGIIPIYDPTNITPIYEPVEITTLEFPPSEPPIEQEFSFPVATREWIKNRDGRRCQFPIIEDGVFVGYLAPENTDALESHHVQPQHYYKNFQPKQYRLGLQHSPLNGITIGRQNHQLIHRAWHQQYHDEYMALPRITRGRYTLETYIQHQANMGRPTWLSTYDKYFYAIATINSYESLIQNPEDRIAQAWSADIERYYQHVLSTMPAFSESYYHYQQ